MYFNYLLNIIFLFAIITKVLIYLMYYCVHFKEMEAFTMNSNESKNIKDEEKRSKGKKRTVGIIISLIVLIGMFVGVVLISNNYNNKPTNKKVEVSNSSKSQKDNNKDISKTKKKNIVVTVVDDKKNKKEYKHSTDAEFLRQALEEIEGITIEGDESDIGLYVKKVNGITADYNTEQSYWAFYIKDEYCKNGVDTQKVTDGDSFKIVYTKD